MHGGGYYTVEFLKAFLYASLKYLPMNVYPQEIPWGSTQDCQKSLANFLASFQKHPLHLNAKPAESANAFSAFCQLLWPTDGISTSTVMTTRWHFYRTVTQRENLERKGIKNICLWHGAHIQQMVFWHVFGSMGFLQLDEEKLRELNIFQSRSLFLSRRSKKESE